MGKLLTSVGALIVAGIAYLGESRADGSDGACVPVGEWVEPATGRAVPHHELFARLAAKRVVLLGETHDSAEHHRWQIHVIAALHARTGNLVLGFEAFPRRVQPALEKWVEGELDEQRFLAESEWNRVWGLDKSLYMPLFDFARMHRIPMIALNVDRALIGQIREQGWRQIPEAEREGVSDPAPASAAYESWLIEVYRQHLARQGSGGGVAESVDRADPGFRRFVEAQLVWDRAMAEAVAEATASSAAGQRLVIGVIGSGHLRNRYGVPRQLAALGVTEASVLLPWDQDSDCADLAPELADAVFGLKSPAGSPPPPRLGVMISTVSDGVEVRVVVQDSVADAAGILAGDVIVSAAGRTMERTADVIATVRRQAPGTWLPLRLVRAGETIDIVAKFPP